MRVFGGLGTGVATHFSSASIQTARRGATIRRTILVLGMWRRGKLCASGLMGGRRFSFWTVAFGESSVISLRDHFLIRLAIRVPLSGRALNPTGGLVSGRGKLTSVLQGVNLTEAQLL